ncbi:Transmembrane protein 69 [Neolecta irregularis DAH-3]|uniref:Transmembrane protein 69 n=1 Tax=Neolecta irregularis (strain DAH-3) TaxID=1198029 RepID=A0A1U7LI71_NEOID|nr:Transmembrane protein 69 [Neolecta irregularis DAH-3]|eukprot:OLL22293.1 Transmembrane protein 69 [Neolecta irregularis DAH-3]
MPPPATSAIKKDLGTFKEFFGDVPKEAMVVGLAGTLPYLATSVTVLGLSWNNQRAYQGITDMFIISPESSEYLLHILQPLQIGYGACIISILGAIHWGLEFAEYGGRQGYNRYALGVLSTVLAWPTVLLPFNYALIVQFVGFTGLWYADVNATKYGWAPPWYMTYRFLLTFIVCTSIVFTLVMQGWIEPHNAGSIQRLDELGEKKRDDLEHLRKLTKEDNQGNERQKENPIKDESKHRAVDEYKDETEADSQESLKDDVAEGNTTIEEN